MGKGRWERPSCIRNSILPPPGPERPAERLGAGGGGAGANRRPPPHRPPAEVRLCGSDSAEGHAIPSRSANHDRWPPARPPRPSAAKTPTPLQAKLACLYCWRHFQGNQWQLILPFAGCASWATAPRATRAKRHGNRRDTNVSIAGPSLAGRSTPSDMPPPSTSW